MTYRELPDRAALHDEVHARPTISIRVPSRVVYIAADTAQVSLEEEWQHLLNLPGESGLADHPSGASFWRGKVDTCTFTWERHTEFSRYVLIQPIAGPADVQAPPFGDFSSCPMSEEWRDNLPGEVFCAIEMILMPGEIEDPVATLADARTLWGDRPVAASLVGNQAHSLVVTDLRIGDDGFERMLVVTNASGRPDRTGRVASRVLDLETYRLMALRGLPVAKELAPLVKAAESDLAELTAEMEARSASDPDLLKNLIALASAIESAISAHAYRFSATAAYNALVEQRLDELHERPVAGTVAIGDFLRRRFSPAVATVVSTDNRLRSLSQRVGHTSSLLRTRVDIASEEQNQQLLSKLGRGQEMQLRLQATVEGLSIAAVSYYVVGLIGYIAKGAHAAGLPVDSTLVAGTSVPFVMAGVWLLIRRTHRRLHVRE